MSTRDNLWSLLNVMQLINITSTMHYSADLPVTWPCPGQTGSLNFIANKLQDNVVLQLLLVALTITYLLPIFSPFSPSLPTPLLLPSSPPYLPHPLPFSSHSTISTFPHPLFTFPHTLTPPTQPNPPNLELHRHPALPVHGSHGDNRLPCECHHHQCHDQDSPHLTTGTSLGLNMATHSLIRTTSPSLWGYMYATFGHPSFLCVWCSGEWRTSPAHVGVQNTTLILILPILNTPLSLTTLTNISTFPVCVTHALIYSGSQD